VDYEQEIRALIERWAAAVHAGDLEKVLDRHTDDIVMFDVPPPDEGVRGIDAYRDVWPPFFRWQAEGAVFEIVSLDVAAGADVAYAAALLRCGTPEEPGRRARAAAAAHARAPHGGGGVAGAARAPLLPRSEHRALGNTCGAVAGSESWTSGSAW
jgi:uncharacterized protein (TIGR02246 family)